MKSKTANTKHVKTNVKGEKGTSVAKKKHTFPADENRKRMGDVAIRRGKP
jgi:hypothetical protein